MSGMEIGKYNQLSQTDPNSKLETLQRLGGELQSKIVKIGSQAYSKLSDLSDKVLANQSAFARAGKLLAAGALGVVGTAGIVVNSVNTLTYVGLPIAMAGNLILGLGIAKEEQREKDFSKFKDKDLSVAKEANKAISAQNIRIQNIGAFIQVVGMFIALPSVASGGCLYLAAILAKNALESPPEHGLKKASEYENTLFGKQTSEEFGEFGTEDMQYSLGIDPEDVKSRQDIQEKMIRAPLNEYPKHIDEYVEKYPSEAVGKTIELLDQYSTSIDELDVEKLKDANIPSGEKEKISSDAAEVLTALRKSGSTKGNKDNTINYLFNTGKSPNFNAPEDRTAVIKNLLRSIDKSKDKISSDDFNSLKNSVETVANKIVGKGAVVNEYSKSIGNQEVCLNTLDALIKATPSFRDIFEGGDYISEQQKDFLKEK